MGTAGDMKLIVSSLGPGASSEDPQRLHCPLKGTESQAAIWLWPRSKENSCGRNF